MTFLLLKPSLVVDCSKGSTLNMQIFYIVFVACALYNHDCTIRYITVLCSLVLKGYFRFGEGLWMNRLLLVLDTVSLLYCKNKSTLSEELYSKDQMVKQSFSERIGSQP